VKPGKVPGPVRIKPGPQAYGAALASLPIHVRQKLLDGSWECGDPEHYDVACKCGRIVLKRTCESKGVRLSKHLCGQCTPRHSDR